MTTLADIEQQCAVVRQQRDAVHDRLMVLRAEIDKLVRRETPAIREHADALAAANAELEAMIEGAPALFTRPRTKRFHRIKVGMAKQKGKVVIADEDKTIRLIRKLLPEDQVELLINTKESVAKSACSDLSAKDLKRLGIRIEADTDAVVIKAEGEDLEKLITGLVGDVDEIEAA